MWELAETRDENSIPRLLGMLGEPNVDYRRSAVKALGVIGTDSVQPVVEVLQTTKDVTVKASCVKAMAQVAYNHPGESFPDAGLQALQTALHEDNPVVHIATAMALGAIGVPALDILTQALKATENPALAIAVLNAISSINDPRSATALQALTQDESLDPYVRESAISALSRFEQMNKIQELKYKN